MDDEPSSLADMLLSLTTSKPLLIPDELFTLWFPPGAIAGVISPECQQAAEAYAAHFQCLFTYDVKLRAGCFIKQKIA